ncbi:hypothetical protein JQK88_35505, partial [Mesorhizobium caraganae]|nr:hypothetical protein [Mesorhizobium caraganae]
MDRGATAGADDYAQAYGVIIDELPHPLWAVAQPWLATAQNYSEMARQIVEQFRRDGFLRSPDEHDALTRADDSTRAPTQTNPSVPGPSAEQPDILGEAMEPRNRTRGKRGRLATEHEEDGRAAQRRQLKVPQPMALGATEWLGDEHIQADYDRLAHELRQTYPRFAAQTRFVSPAVVHFLRLAEPAPLQ